MAIYPIRTFGDPVLRSKAVEVTDDAESLQRLVDGMLETMYEAPGVGLAAPQIGISKAIFVADVGEGPFVMVNPEVVELSGSWTFDEGCLSVPGYYWPIKRPGYCKARGFDVHGNEITYEGEELMGRVLQHEIDHLNGMLLLERLPRRTRKQALKEMRERQLGLIEGP
ncbi:MAG: peptide deformylase [Acidimicrobiia bacterium]|nr:peptide deformylase [Acidimicrobiia bacterium]